MYVYLKSVDIHDKPTCFCYPVNMLCLKLIFKDKWANKWKFIAIFCLSKNIFKYICVIDWVNDSILKILIDNTDES